MFERRLGTVSDEITFPVRLTTRISPPPSWRARYRARATAFALVSAWAVARRCPSFTTSQLPDRFSLMYRLLAVVAALHRLSRGTVRVGSDGLRYRSGEVGCSERMCRRVEEQQPLGFETAIDV